MSATENVVDLQRPISTSTPARLDFGNITSLSQLLGSPSVRGMGREIYLSKRGDNNLGSGTAEDPFDASSQEAFQDALDDLPDNSVVHVLPELYDKYVLLISKSVTIIGPRAAKFTQAIGADKPIFTLFGSLTQLTLVGFTMEHGAVFREEHNLCAIFNPTACDKIRLVDLHTTDFNSTLLSDGTANVVEVYGCEFDYTYGRAGISNVSPYTQPCAAISGSGIKKLYVDRRNRFNGLTDPTFSGVSGWPPASQLVAADNFVQTGYHDYAVVANNTVLNHGVEGIFLFRGTPAGIYTYIIEGNDTVAAKGVAGAYAPGVSLLNTRGVVAGNTISGSPLSINATFDNYDESENVLHIDGNKIERALIGIVTVKESSLSTISGNRIWNSSEPCRTTFGQLVDEAHGCRPTELIGIMTTRSRVSHNLLIASEPIWDQTDKTLSSRSTNHFTLNNVTGMTANVGVLVSYAGGVASFFPVQGISGNVVTVDSSFAIAAPDVTSGALYYARSVSDYNFTGGIVVQNGGNVTADHNVVIGHMRDLGNAVSGTITVGNHTTHSCHMVQPDNGTFIHVSQVNTRFDLTALENDWTSDGFKVWQLINTDSAPNTKIMRWEWDAGFLTMRALNDDGSPKALWIQFQPDGASNINKIYTNAVKFNTGAYLNFSPTEGVTGYGLRDNSGVIEVKNSGGAWNGVNASVTRLHVSEVATLDLPLGSDQDSLASGTLATITFNGSPSYTQPPTILRLLVSNGPQTITIPTSYRIGETSSTTSIKLDNGNHELSWVYSNLKYWLADSGTPPVLTVATLPSGATRGDTASISDGDSGLAWGATAVNSGGGATPYQVWFNGTVWTVTGK